MARWFPRGLTGQLLALLIGGLLVTHAIGLLVLSQDQGGIHPLARIKATELFARMFRGVEALDAQTASAVLAHASDPQTRFSITADPGEHVPGPNASPADAEASKLAERALQTLLALPVAVVHACAGPGCEPEPLGASPDRPRLPLVLQAQRDDGLWMQATLWTEVRTRWWRPVSFWLQISLIPVVLAVVVIVRSVARPGRALVAASGRASRGERVEPLVVEGPREMREIVRAFNQMQLRISRFVEDRTRMLAAISHDFRTPITSLRLRAELLQDESVRTPMIRTLDEMRCMVDETLCFTRDEALHEPTATVDLHALLEEVIAEQRALGHDVRWAAAPAPLAPYRCRPLSLKRAVANLVENAVRHGQRARLTLALHGDPPTLHIDVDDDGPGIAQDSREAVFAPFVRLARAGTAAPAGGSGLGLSIARSNARAHGGDVLLMDGPDARGLRARVLLPVA